MNRLEKVRAIVAAALAEIGDEQPFGDDDSLVVPGRLSSLDVVNILVALEEAFGLEVRADEFDPIRFDTVRSILELVESHA